ncbi:MAG: hypothetical protein AB4426_33930 [Xenococcaceae cyanobacterium]
MNFNSVFLGAVPLDATEILEDGREASEALAKSIDGLWNAAFSSGLYLALVRLGLLFALGSLAFFVVQWLKAMLDGEESQALSQLLWPLIVVFLLSNSGAPLAGATKELRALIHTVNQEVLELAIADTNLQVAYELASTENAVEQVIAGKRDACYGLENTGERVSCIQDAASEAQNFIQDYRNRQGNPTFLEKAWESAEALLDDPLDAALNVVGSVVQLAIENLFWVFHHGFQLLIELSLLVTGLLGPLAVGGSLLPGAQKSLLAWLTGFFAIGMAKLSFNILSGLVSLIVLNAGDTDPLILPLFLGLLAPVISLALASGGGMAVFNGFSQYAGLLSAVAVYTGAIYGRRALGRIARASLWPFKKIGNSRRKARRR